MSSSLAGATASTLTDLPLVHVRGSSRKRRRITRACDACKTRKKRCSGELPCETCRTASIDCTYLSSYSRGQPPTPTPAGTLDHLASSEPESLIDSSKSSRRVSPETAGTDLAGQYHGPTSAHAFLQRAWNRVSQYELPNDPQLVADNASDQRKSIFSSGDRDFSGVPVFRMPQSDETRPLLSRYFDFVMPTYRFLHRATISNWLERYHQDPDHQSTQGLANSQRAIVLLVLSTAAIWNVDEEGRETSKPLTNRLSVGDMLFKASQDLLESEKGHFRLESVQARFASVLYLLITSRPNQAWFIFGTTVQIAMAMGLHRKTHFSPATQNYITRQCERRVIWSCYTLDYYLSIMFGRPRLLHDEDIDQEFPDEVNDEDMAPDGVRNMRNRRDCLMKAPIFHAQLAQIVGRASRDQYSLRRMSTAERMAMASDHNGQLERWHHRLPPFLSGAIHASSLIPVLWRQMTVLSLAHCHGLMLVNRPFLLYKTEQSGVAEHIKICVRATTSVIDIILGFVYENHVFPFWYTQYITFNALTIAYVYVIQLKRGRIQCIESIDEETLFTDAQTTQQHLAKATELNAPSMRYSLILNELRQLAYNLMQQTDNQADDLTLSDAWINHAEFSPQSASPDFSLGFDFWPQLDSLPLARFT